MLAFPNQLGFAPLQEQEAWQLNALQQLLSYLRSHSPFYREKLSASSTGALKSLRHLEELPFTTKEDLQQRNWDFLCTPRAAVREYMTTSGTMGKPVTIALTESDLQRLAYNECQAFRCAGGHEGEVYQLALTLDRQFMAGMAYYGGILKMGASVVRCGPGLPQMQWETIGRLQTSALVAVPSFLLAMAGWARGHGISPAESPVRKAICIGESLRRADFSLSALGAKLNEAWPLALHATYASTEMQTAFTECAAGLGGHQQPELIIAEVVDDDGNMLPDGAPGEVVVTTLGVEGMPLLRYRTGDVAALHPEPCSCGRLSKRLGPILGRKGQMIKYRGTTLYPPAIFDILDEAEFVRGYVVEVFSNEHDIDELCLRIHASLPPDTCGPLLRTLLQSRLRVAPTLQFHTEAEMQAMQRPAGARKTIRFLDRRQKP